MRPYNESSKFHFEFLKSASIWQNCDKNNVVFCGKNGADLIEKIPKDILKNKFPKKKKLNPGAQRKKKIPHAKKAQ